MVRLKRGALKTQFSTSSTEEGAIQSIEVPARSRGVFHPGGVYSTQNSPPFYVRFTAIREDLVEWKFAHQGTPASFIVIVHVLNYSDHPIFAHLYER
jgi:hypothetical protein